MCRNQFFLYYRSSLHVLCHWCGRSYKGHDQGVGEYRSTTPWSRRRSYDAVYTSFRAQFDRIGIMHEVLRLEPTAFEGEQRWTLAYGPFEELGNGAR